MSKFYVDGTLTNQVAPSRPITKEDLAGMVSALNKQPEPEWLLISPNSIVYRGTADQLMPVIGKHVSFLNNRASAARDHDGLDEEDGE